jgi:hypothetical protein
MLFATMLLVTTCCVVLLLQRASKICNVLWLLTCLGLTGNSVLGLLVLLLFLATVAAQLGTAVHP